MILQRKDLTSISRPLHACKPGTKIHPSQGLYLKLPLKTLASLFCVIHQSSYIPLCPAPKNAGSIDGEAEALFQRDVGMQAEAVARVVEQVGADIDRHVVEVLLDKFQLTAHFAAIKRYLLLGQVGLFRQAHTL